MEILDLLPWHSLTQVGDLLLMCDVSKITHFYVFADVIQ